MGLALGGLQSGGTPITGTDINVNDITARSISLTQASGSNAVLIQTTGARLKLSSAGTTDYLESNGTTTISAAGSFSVGNSLSVRNNVASNFLSVGLSGTQYFGVSTTAVSVNAVTLDLSTVGSVVSSSAGSIPMRMGTASGAGSTATLQGVANVNTTAVGNVGAGEDDLITFSLIANCLTGNGHGVRITAWGDGANNANAKTLRMYFGATALVTTSLTAGQADTWRIEATVIRTGAATQVASAQLLQFGATTLIDVENTSPGETLTGAVTIKCTGDATADDDIRQLGMIVEYI